MRRWCALWALPVAGLLAVGACGGPDAPSPARAQLELAVEAATALRAAVQLGGPVAEVGAEGPEPMAEVAAAYVRKFACAQVKAGAGLISAHMGPGCVLAGRSISGDLTVTHTRGEAGSQFGLLLDSLQWAELTLDGSVQQGVLRAGAYQVDATLMVLRGHTMSEQLYSGTVRRVPGGLYLDGMASRDDGSGVRNLAFEAVYLADGASHPTAGKISVEAQGQPTAELTFGPDPDALRPVTEMSRNLRAVAPMM